MLGIDYRQYAVMNENCHFRVHGIMNPCIQSSSIPTVCLNCLGETIPMCFQFFVLTEMRKSYQFTDYYFCGRVPWRYQYWPGGFMLFVVLCPGTPEGSNGSGSGFKASQKTGQRLKVSSDRLGEAGNRTCDPWFTRHGFIPYTTAAERHRNTFFHAR